MKLSDYFDFLGKFVEFIKRMKEQAKADRPFSYAGRVSSILAGQTAEVVLNVSPEGPFICESFLSQFIFDTSDLPQIDVKIYDDSNGGRALVPDWLPLSLISSCGKKGNQMLAPFPFVHYFGENANIRFEFRNNSSSDASGIDFALFGRQTTIKGL